MKRFKRDLRLCAGIAAAILGFIAWKADGHYTQAQLWMLGFWAIQWAACVVGLVISDAITAGKADKP